MRGIPCIAGLRTLLLLLFALTCFGAAEEHDDYCLDEFYGNVGPTEYRETGRDARITGKIEQIMAMSPDGHTGCGYYVKGTEKGSKQVRNYTLVFGKDAPLHLPTGTKVALHGKLNGGVLSLESGSSPASLQVTEPVVVAAGPSVINVTVIMVNFLDSTLIDISPADIDGLVNSNASSLKNYYAWTSNGKLSVNCAVKGPYKINYNGIGRCDFGLWAAAADEAAGVDYRNGNRLYVLAPSGCGWGGLAQIGGNQAWINGSYWWWQGGYCHEFGHNLGLSHARANGDEYGDDSDTMGNPYFPTHLNGPHMEQLGWTSGITTITSPGTYDFTLNALEVNTTATQIIKMPQGSTGYNYYLSYRAPIGLDASNLEPGYQYGTSVHRYSGGGWETYLDQIIGDGQTFSDTGNNITVTQTGHTATTCTIRVTYGFTGIVPPTISSQPASQTVNAGQSATFTVTASGTAPLSYQWWKGGAPISGANSSTYTTPPTTSADDGKRFSVVVSNAAGSLSSNIAILSVNSAVSNNASFVSQSVPTAMNAGQTYAVSVTMNNTGTSTWTESAQFRLGSQNPQDNAVWGMSRVSLPSGVAPGQNAAFSFNVTAPATAGTYSFQWRMVQDGVEWFGGLSQNVAIAVSAVTTLQPPVITSPTAGNVFPSSTSAVTVAWNAVPGISIYLIRCMDLTTQQLFLVNDSWTQTSASVPVVDGHEYSFWMHSSLNFSYDNPNSYSAASSVSFSVSNSNPGNAYRASTDFSSVQGQRGWSYLDSNGQPMVFEPANNYWRGPETYLILWAGGGHPGNQADAILRWTSPQSGSARITGNAHDLNPGGGAGVTVQIRKGSTVLWQSQIANADSVGVDYDLTVSMAAGESLDFVINRGIDGVWSYDSTYFDPTIVLTPSNSSSTYQASTDFSSVQGQRGWSYLDSNGNAMVYEPAGNYWKGPETYLILWAGGGHPGNQADAILRWTSPQTGSARITGNAHDLNPDGGEGVTVQIRKGATVLWERQIANGDAVGVDYDLTVSMTAGESLDFVINRGVDGTWSYDSTFFDPTIALSSAAERMPISDG